MLLQAIRDHSLQSDAADARDNAGNDAIRINVRDPSRRPDPGFLQNQRNDVAAIREALNNGDFETVEHLGHGMRGAGGSWGFDEVTVLGAGLERAAQSGDRDASYRLADELSRYLDRVEVTSDP